MAKHKGYLFDKKENVKKVLHIFYIFCGILFISDFIIHRHTYHSWEEIPAFYAVFGFCAYVLIVFTATILRRIVMRPEDYYEGLENEDE